LLTDRELLLAGKNKASVFFVFGKVLAVELIEIGYIEAV
jgi:hypothetical protein